MHVQFAPALMPFCRPANANGVVYQDGLALKNPSVLTKSVLISVDVIVRDYKYSY